MPAEPTAAIEQIKESPIAGRFKSNPAQIEEIKQIDAHFGETQSAINVETQNNSVNKTDDSVIKVLDAQPAEDAIKNTPNFEKPNKSLVDFIEGKDEDKVSKSISVNSQKSEGKTLSALKKCIKKQPNL